MSWKEPTKADIERWARTPIVSRDNETPTTVVETNADGWKYLLRRSQAKSSSLQMIGCEAPATAPKPVKKTIKLTGNMVVVPLDPETREAVVNQPTTENQQA